MITVIHCMHDVALPFLDTFAEFQKDCIISSMPKGLYFVFQYFSVTSIVHLADSDTFLQSL